MFKTLGKCQKYFSRVQTEFVWQQGERKITWIKFTSIAASFLIHLLWGKKNKGGKEYKSKSGLLGFLMPGPEALTRESQQVGVAPGTGIKFSRAGKESLCSLDQMSGLRKHSYPNLFTNKHFHSVN